MRENSQNFVFFVFNNWFEAIFSFLWIGGVFWFGFFNYYSSVINGIPKWLIFMGLLALMGFPGTIVYIHTIIKENCEPYKSKSYLENLLLYLLASFFGIPFGVMLLWTPLLLLLVIGHMVW